MSDAGIPAEALAILEVVAGAIRRELGAAIDAYPGRREPEQADPLNRASGPSSPRSCAGATARRTRRPHRRSSPGRSSSSRNGGWRRTASTPAGPGSCSSSSRARPTTGSPS